MPDMDTKTVKVDTRVSPQEKELMRRAAEKSDRKLSAWIRWKLLRGLKPAEAPGP